MVLWAFSQYPIPSWAWTWTLFSFLYWSFRATASEVSWTVDMTSNSCPVHFWLSSHLIILLVLPSMTTVHQTKREELLVWGSYHRYEMNLENLAQSLMKLEESASTCCWSSLESGQKICGSLASVPHSSGAWQPSQCRALNLTFPPC